MLRTQFKSSAAVLYPIITMKKIIHHAECLVDVLFENMDIHDHLLATLCFGGGSRCCLRCLARKYNHGETEIIEIILPDMRNERDTQIPQFHVSTHSIANTATCFP